MAALSYRLRRDPVFLLGLAAYALTRLALPSTAVLHGHLADVWLIPCALPPILRLHDRLAWRRPGPPRHGEVLSHLIGWSLLFEAIGPRLWSGTVGDPWDVVSYAAGAAIATLGWRYTAGRRWWRVTFDHLAPVYLTLERALAGNLLQRGRTRYLGRLRSARHMLVLGPGRGRFVAALLEAHPALHVTLVDSSAGMLARVARDLSRAGLAGRVTCIQADVTTWDPPPGAFDAVASHFFLDCFDAPRLDRVIAAVTRGLRPGAPWLIADFAIPARGVARWRALFIHRAMYLFFHHIVGIPATRLVDPAPWLERAGWRLEARGRLNAGLLQSDLWRYDAVAP